MEQTMSDVTLYGFPRSVYVQMAGIVLTDKEVPYTFHDLETEMNTARHIALHPFERVPCDGSEPEGVLREALARDFGRVARWRTEFAAIGKALRGGSGWLLPTWSPRDRKLVNQWAVDHTTTLAGGQPILALDMCEHAYHLDYEAQAAAYVDALMASINWSHVARTFDGLAAEVCCG
jgi:superoxide dismutase